MKSEGEDEIDDVDAIRDEINVTCHVQVSCWIGVTTAIITGEFANMFEINEAREVKALL